MLEGEGLSGLTMRRLADRLGVSTMALYNHVPNKQALCQGIAEALVSRARFETKDVDWRRRIMGCFRELRRICRAYPEAVGLLQSLAEPPQAVFLPMRITLGAIGEIGIAGDDALRAYYLLVNFTMGQTAYEAHGPFKGLEVPGETMVSDDVAPGTSHALGWDFDRAFEFGLETILAGLALRGAR